MEMQPESSGSEQDPRVREYLDDKLQTQADFAGLDTLLQQTRHQQELLKKQVCYFIWLINVLPVLTFWQLDEAIADLESATEALLQHEGSVQKKVEVFLEQQGDIDRRLKYLTEATTSDDAVKMYDSSMGKLRRLDLAAGYLQLLTKVDALG